MADAGDHAAGLDTLPPEVMTAILDFLDLPSISAVAASSTELHALATDPYVWARRRLVCSPTRTTPEILTTLSTTKPFLRHLCLSGCARLDPSGTTNLCQS